MSESLRAKVFISCGQRKDTDEITIAHRIAERLSQLGYDPYIAVEEQTLKGVKENIFAQLASSEYFVFVDFKREGLKTGRKKEYRGSLFCHQELAIASYLDIPCLALQEGGVKHYDGILGFLQGNAVSFTDRHLLPSVIADEVQKRGWKANWKCALRLTRCLDDHEDSSTIYGPCRFFQIDVRNEHRDKIAVNCYAYLESARDLVKGQSIPVETAEHKWRGYLPPNANIMAQSHRRFDSFFVRLALPRELLFNVHTDYAGLIPKLDGSGPFELSYVVYAENFPPARGTFRLALSDNLDDIQLDPVSTDSSTA
jgi:hypothetical protein